MTSLVKSYLGLCKLRVVALIVFTAMVGMFLATSPPGMVPPVLRPLAGEVCLIFYPKVNVWIPSAGPVALSVT